MDGKIGSEGQIDRQNQEPLQRESAKNSADYHPNTMSQTWLSWIEPFSGLDPVNTELLKQVILKEKERGAIIIFSDHVMTNVEELCDDILMIRDGRVVLHGPVQDVRNQYGKTRLFVSSERSKEELENLPHVKQVSLTKQGSWKLILEDESAGRELFPILTQGQYIATFDQQAPTIDEIFKLESGVEVWEICGL